MSKEGHDPDFRKVLENREEDRSSGNKYSIFKRMLLNFVSQKRKNPGVGAPGFLRSLSNCAKDKFTCIPKRSSSLKYIRTFIPYQHAYSLFDHSACMSLYVHTFGSRRIVSLGSYSIREKRGSAPGRVMPPANFTVIEPLRVFKSSRDINQNGGR